MPAPVTPWGKVALGLKTRKHKKYSNKLIVKRAGKKVGPDQGRRTPHP